MQAVLAGLSLWLAAVLCPVSAAERLRVEIQTNLGSFVIELYPDYAPKTVTNFLQYLADNHPFDFESPTPGGWGYTVFGRVIKGTEVIDAMAAIPVLAGGDFMGDVPSGEIVLEKARVLPPDGK